jgi:hypothetical protein
MHHPDHTALTAAGVRQPAKCRITAEVPRSLHDEFMLTCTAMDATASKLYRDFMRAYSQAHAAERAAYGAIHENI